MADILYLYPNEVKQSPTPRLRGDHTDIDDPHGSPDGETTHVRNSYCFGTYGSSYGVQDTEILGTTIDQVTLVYRWKGGYDPSAVPEMKHLAAFAKIKTHGVSYSVDAGSWGETWRTRSKTWTTNPNTGLAWTWEEIDDLIIYLSSKWAGDSSYPAGKITQAYIKVEGTWWVLPTVTTQAASDVTHNSATGNGNITAIGGINCTERGFEYKEGATQKNITGASQEDPCKITAVGHGFATDDVVVITDIVGMTELNGKTYTITKIDDDNFTLNDIDATGYAAYVNSGKVAKWEGDVSTISDTGDYGTGAFTKGLTDLKPNVLYYIRSYAKNVIGNGYGLWLYFTTDKTTPTVTTQDPTEVDQTTLTGNGNITCTGGVDCTIRGFKYGYTPVDTWDAHDNGAYGIGAFTKAVVDLSANTVYWIRAYATNTEGTSYGEYVKVTTAASGTTPSGTKIQLASDYSGYVDQLHASEQDLGVDYKGYFVLTTDLAEKRSLAYLKRLLYLTNYFRKESSGTVTIYVKCDNEASWRELGEVDLTGTEDILTEDLGIDELAKHFLIKFEGENAFRYIGTIFWSLLQGVR